MQSDLDSIEKIRNAVEDGKLTLRGKDEEFLDSAEECLEGGSELSSRQRKWLGDIQGRISPW